jgi:hypothetical protein
MKRPYRGLLAVLALVATTWWCAETPTPVAWAQTPPRNPAQRANAKTPLQSLVSAEKEFAALSDSKGMRAAFLANLDDQSVVFKPLAVNGKSVWKERPESQAKLLWMPSYAEVSAAGDFGVTSGPWEYHPAPGEDAAPSYGEFLSVWGRDPRTPWKVLLDIGVSHEKPEGALDQVEATPGPVHPLSAASDSAGPAVLMTIDQSMAKMVGRIGGKAVGTWLAKDLLYLREGALPAKAQQANESLAGSIKHTNWRPSGSRVARSGDLGCTYGVREDSTGVPWEAPDTTAYVHVWRRLEASGQWKLAAVVESPVKHTAP